MAGSQVLAGGGGVPGLALRGWFKVAGGVAVSFGGGVTSVTKASAGNFTANFAVAMPDANVVLKLEWLRFFGSTSDVFYNGAGATAVSIRCRVSGVDNDPPESFYVGIYG